MTIHNPPLFLQAGTYTAEKMRRGLAASWAKAGVVGPADLLVHQTTVAGLNLEVDGGFIVIDGSEGTYQGRYVCENRGVETVTLGAGDGTNPRKDLIVARVKDAALSGAVNAFAVEVVAGTPAASPAEPSVAGIPNALVLAMVDVPAGDTAIANAQITDRRYASAKGLAAARGAPIITTGGTANWPVLAGFPEGQLLYDMSLDRAVISNGSAWVGLSAMTAPPPQIFTGTVLGGGATSFTSFITQNAVLVAPYPLTMIVRLSGDMSGNAAQNTVDIDITDHAGTPIHLGPITGGGGVRKKNFHTDHASPYYLMGRRDYAAGATCGFRARYKVDTSNIFIGGVAEVTFLPKVS